MIIFEEAKLGAVALHLVGNKSREEGVKVGKELLTDLSVELKQVLRGFFLDSFSMDTYYHFGHETDLEMNEVFCYCRYIFEEEEELYPQSVSILQHLYAKSFHPGIAAGELFVCKIDDVVVEDELVSAIGIFKTEKKEDFIKINYADEQLEVIKEQGIQTRKPDKAALILNMYGEEGYRVLTVDLKGGEARYWQDDFLGLLQVRDNNFHTKNYLQMCKDYVKEVYSKESDKIEQSILMNKAVDYFTKSEKFDFPEFSYEVFEDKQQVEDFSSYKKAYFENKGTFSDEDFFISPKAVQQMKKKFKNMIKLDTQMEIRLGSDADSQEHFVERGYDEEKGMYFYKLFFNSEK